jgi:hypothetical protein
MNPTELEALINRHLDGVATEAEVAALSRELEQDEAGRRRYLGLAQLHATLAASESAEPLAEVSAASRIVSLPHFAWRPPSRFAPRYALAVMLVLGMLLGAAVTGVVLAYTAPARPEPRLTPLPVPDGGFEPGAPLTRGGPPAEVGHWQGDVCEVADATGAVKPHEGAGMLKFISVNPAGDMTDTRPICSDLWQVLALETGRQRTLKVRAWFNADTGAKPARFHLYAMAGAGDEATAPALWAARFGESSDILASGRTLKFVDADPATWEAAEVTLEVPPDARLLVIGIAAYRLPAVRQPAQWLPAQFADAVSVSVVESEAAK